MESLSCPNSQSPPSGRGDVGTIIRHGFYTTRSGKRRRYQCQTCGKTFCSTTRTPYHRLQHRRATFDEVAALWAQGLNKFCHRSSPANRLEYSSSLAGKSGCLVSSLQRSKNTKAVCRGASSRRDPNDRRGQGTAIWVLVVIDVWSRLWPSTVVGKRRYRNTLDLFRDLSYHRESSFSD